MTNITPLKSASRRSRRNRANDLNLVKKNTPLVKVNFSLQTIGTKPNAKVKPLRRRTYDGRISRPNNLWHGGEMSTVIRLMSSYMIGSRGLRSYIKISRNWKDVRM